MTIMVTAIGAATGTTGATGKDNMETTMDTVATITAMNAVTTTITGVRSSRVSVILSRLARCVPLPGHTGNVFNHPHETVLPIDQQKNRQLESFFIDWEERAFYLAYAALWDRESALDAVQEAMTRLVEYYRDKPAEEWPALFRTILNSKINDIRRRRMIEQGKHKLMSLTGLFQKDNDTPGANMEYELPADGREDGITSPEAELVAGELRSRVTDALQSLSERQRQVFILREWRGMTIRETAQTLGCSENSVKQHHFRALRTLRVQLAEVWNHAQAATS
jgi:RNA polymerase sigma-70 factor (ECF subfamily)